MNQTPKIAFFLPSLRGGGAERVIAILANQFVKRGYRVEVILARLEGTHVASVETMVRLVDLKASGVLASLPALAWHFKQSKPDAILATMTHANMAALIASMIVGRLRRSSIALRQANVFSESIKIRTTTSRWLLGKMVGLVYPRARTIVAISNGVAADLATRYPRLKRILRVIHNPINQETITSLAREDVVHPFFGDGPPIVLAAGRLVPDKDHHTLLRAFAKLHGERDVRMAILGEGPLLSRLVDTSRELGIEDAVTFLGFQQNPFRFMGRAALFVSSSRSEGFGNVIVEAMACGTPVVSTDCPGGPYEILEGGKWGRLVPVGDPEALAAAMAAALDDPSPPDVRRRAADFGVDRAVDAYLDALGLPPYAAARAPELTLHPEKSTST